MLRFRSLASGSSGNATLVQASSGLHRTQLLVDCGLGVRQLSQRLQQAGSNIAEIDGIFITHEHGDHVGCALSVARMHGIALWMSQGTADALGLVAGSPGVSVLRDGDAVAVGELLLQPFTVPHDAREPLQLVCTDGHRSVGFLTDIGHVTPYALDRLRACSALLLEANHDPDLLQASAYPLSVKRRVSGLHGHLSNAQAALALAELAHERLHAVVAAHLSERNNRPELVQQVFAEVLGCGRADVLFTTPQGRDWLDA